MGQKMVISGFYNEVNQTMIITSGEVCINSKTEGNITSFYNEKNELIGMNIKKYAYVGGPIVDVSKITEFNNGGEIENPYIYATIVQIDKHPKSDKLNICQVNDGNTVHQIVCGASNVEVNKVVVMAKKGAVMPSGMCIKPTKVIDIDSSGMLCSYRELGIDIDASGIIIRDDLSLVGKSFLGE